MRSHHRHDVGGDFGPRRFDLGSPRSAPAHLFQDNRARRVGDILTVAIDESTNANEREQRALDKNNATKAIFNFPKKPTGGSSSADLQFSNSSSRNFNGSAQLTSDRRFIDRMTVTVVDVLPNGNLVIEGYRSRMVAGEQRVLRITGIVRPTDIGQQNTVESHFVASFHISYLGKGPESSFTNQGWFSRMINRIWPF